MHIGNKFKAIIQSKELEKNLISWMNAAKYVYNAKVGEYNYYYKFLKWSLDDTGADHFPVTAKYAHLAKDPETGKNYHWLQVPSSILSVSANNFHSSMIKFMRGLSKVPTIKNKSHNSLTLNNEMFQVVEIDGEIYIEICTFNNKTKQKATSFGFIKIANHREYQNPKTIVLKVNYGKWTISFSYDDDLSILTDQEKLDFLQTLTKEELYDISCGNDRGCTKPLVSDGIFFDKDGKQEYNKKRAEVQRIKLTKRKAKKYDVALRDGKAKPKKGKAKLKNKYVTTDVPNVAPRINNKTKASNNIKKLSKQIAGKYEYAANCRKDFNHKVSFNLTKGDKKLYIFEDLKVVDMTKKAKPKKNKTGKYVKNNAAQKTGLNKAILAVGWGQLLTFVTYKANRKGGLVITVPPQYTSQECSQCGFISKENRKTQADFACQTCGYSDNADSNASYNIKKKGVEMIYNKSFTFKEKKKVSTRKTMGKVVALHDGNIHDMPCIIHANGELYLD